MATNLKMEALIHLNANEELQGQIASFAGIKKEGVPTAILRNSRTLTTYRAVVLIAESMGKEPEEILEETPE